MHKRYTFVLIFLLSLFCFNVSAMKLATIGQAAHDFARAQFDVVEHIGNIAQRTGHLTQLAMKTESREEHVLNGHFTCTDLYTLLEVGAQKYQKKEFDEARIFWEHVLHQPHNDQIARALAWYNLGHAYYELGQSNNTIRAWEEAVQQNNDFFIKADALYNLYVLYSVEEQEETALQKYEALKTLLFNTQHTEKDPFHEADALYYLSGVCEVGGELEEALKYYDMTLLLLERIGRFHSNKATQVQAFNDLAQLANIAGDRELAKSYQENANLLQEPL